MRLFNTLFVVSCFLVSSAFVFEPNVSAKSKQKSAPTPVAAANADVDLLYYYFEVDPYSNGLIYGEFKNHSDHAVASPRIGFTFFDKDGNILGTTDATPVFSVIQPGQQMPFFGLLSQNGPKLNAWNRVEPRFCPGFDEDVATYTVDGLALKGVKTEVKTDSSVLIDGSVKNTRTTDAANVAVAIFFYKKDGRFSGNEVDYLPLPIPAGKSEQFTVDVGVNMFLSSEPIKHAGLGYTFKVVLSSGIGVSMGC